MVRASRRSGRRACSPRSTFRALDAWSVSWQGVCSGCARHEVGGISSGSITVRWSAFPVLFALAIGALLGENLLYFPLSVPYMKALAAGTPLLDMRLGYTPSDAYDLLDRLGQTGRGAYLRLLWTIDLLLPALFGFFLSYAVRRGAFRAWRSIPLLAAACDYVENSAITILLLHYPLHEPAFARLASVFTVTKLFLYASGMLLAVGGFLTREKTASWA